MTLAIRKPTLAKILHTIRIADDNNENGVHGPHGYPGGDEPRRKPAVRRKLAQTAPEAIQSVRKGESNDSEQWGKKASTDKGEICCVN